MIGARRGVLFSVYGRMPCYGLLSLFIAVVLVSLFLPKFGNITGKELSLNFDINFVLSVLGITVATGIIAGSYPALYLSAFKPAAVLKGKFATSVSESMIRKGLVVFQFAISVSEVAYWLYKQTEFIVKKSRLRKDNISQFTARENTQASPLS